MSRCECMACGKVFGSITGFDKHRVGRYSFDNTRRCLSDKELIAKGLHKNPDGVWRSELSRAFALRKLAD